MKTICHNFYRKIIFNASALIAVKVELLSHSGRIYMDSLQQKQAILSLSDLYSAILLMRDTLFLVV